MKISLITICYNSCKTIARTIESVLAQNDIQLEYLIIDGASKDNTVSIVESYRSQFEEKGFSYIVKSEPDNGIYDAMNKGVKLANGDIIGILNSDDYYAESDILSTVESSFEKYKTDILYGNLLYVKNNKPFRYWKSGKLKSFKSGWMPPHPAFFVKKDVYEKYGLFRLDCGTAADYELMLRFLEKNKASSIWIDKLFTYMDAGGASSANLTAYKKAHANDKKAWICNELHRPFFSIWLKKIRKLKQFIIPKKIKDELTKFETSMILDT